MMSVSSLNTKFLKEKPYKVDVNMPFFQSFWQKINQPTQALQYVCELITKIIAHENKKGSKHEDFVELHFISTMNTCSLLLKLEGEELLKQAKIRWEEHSKKTNLPNQHPYTQRIVNNIFKLHIEKEDIIGAVLSQACFMRDLDITFDTFRYEDVAAQYKKSVDMIQHFRSWQYLPEHTTLMHQALRNKEMEILDTGEFSFNYEYFVRYMQENKRVTTRELQDSFRVLFKALPVAVTDAPHSSQIAASCLLHVLKQTITLYPVVEMENLKALMLEMSTLRKWPLPSGLLANDVFQILLQEMKCPGHALRMYLRENIPMIDVLLSDTEDLDSNVTNAAHCLYEDTLEVESILNVNYNNLQTTPNLEPHQYRCLIIIHILQCMTSIMQDKVAAHILSLSIRNIFIIYSRMMNILDKCDELTNVADARSIQEGVFKELLTEILKLSEGSAPSKSLMSKILNEFSTFVPPAPIHQLKELNHTTPKTREVKAGLTILALNNLKKAEKREIPVVVEYEYVNRAERFAQILKSTKKPAMPLHEAPLKFCIMGGDFELHCFLQDLLTVFKNNPNMFLNTDIRVFLVPTRYCSLAHYIAAKDYWYQRNVWVPFRANPLVPRVSQAGQDTGKTMQGESMPPDKEKDIFPYVIKEGIVQSYLREATIKYNPVVFEVLCFANLPTDKYSVPDSTFYCMQYLEIGASVLVHKLKVEKKLPPETPYFELEDHKSLKDFSIELKIRANYCEFTGVIKEVEDSVTKTVHDFVINNVPREYMKTCMPIPNSGWLEVAYLETENHKSLLKAYESKDKMKKVRGDHVNAAFTALYNQLHVSSVSLTAPKGESFEMVIDGKLYEQKFNTITVQPVDSKGFLKDKNFTLPIMTFLPIQT